MQKRKYSHVQNILPQVQQMISEGMCYREIAEYYGFDNPKVIKSLIYREKRKHYRVYLNNVVANRQKHYQSINTKINDYKWKMNYCGIFCNPWKGCET